MIIFNLQLRLFFKVKYEARISVFLPRGGRLDIGRLRRREGQEEVRQEVEKDRDRWPEAARVQDVRFGDAQVPRLPIRPRGIPGRNFQSRPEEDDRYRNFPSQ